jgi:hypothetical protein
MTFWTHLDSRLSSSEWSDPLPSSMRTYSNSSLLTITLILTITLNKNNTQGISRRHSRTLISRECFMMAHLALQITQHFLEAVNFKMSTKEKILLKTITTSFLQSHPRHPWRRNKQTYSTLWSLDKRINLIMIREQIKMSSIRITFLLSMKSARAL